MASVHDVAAYIEQRLAQTPNPWRLQKLVYYAQAWSMVWDDVPLFNEPLEAWKQGPVVPILRRDRLYDSVHGDPNALTDEAKATIEGVLDFYGKLSAKQLSELTHREQPWRRARGGLAPSESSRTPITLSDLSSYYGRDTGGKRIHEEVRLGILFLLDTPEEQVDALDGRETVAVDSAAALHWLSTGGADPWPES